MKYKLIEKRTTNTQCRLSIPVLWNSMKKNLLVETMMGYSTGLSHVQSSDSHRSDNRDRSGDIEWTEVEAGVS